MPTSTVLFKTNRTQAVRLPRDVAFPDGVHDVEIVKVGDSRVISPVGQRWDTFFARHSTVSDDFLVERNQGAFEDRDDI